MAAGLRDLSVKPRKQAEHVCRVSGDRRSSLAADGSIRYSSFEQCRSVAGPTQFVESRIFRSSNLLRGRLSSQ